MYSEKEYKHALKMNNTFKRKHNGINNIYYLSIINSYEKDLINKHLKDDIKESEKSIKEDKELEKTLGRMM